jgi:LytS/YehU family sensor histidine kinase
MTAARSLALFSALTVVALIFASQLYVVYQWEGIPITFAVVFATQLAHWYTWGLAGPIAWKTGTRWPLRGPRTLPNTMRHVVAGVTIGLLVITVYAAVLSIAMNQPLTSRWFQPLGNIRTFGGLVVLFFSLYFHIELLTYGAIVAVANAVGSNRELRERERETLQLSSQLTAARLQVLTAQLQPHFLFNTLHTIGSLILQRKNDAAMEMLAELGELLRITLHRQSAESIPLKDELDHLKRYVRIEEARFGDRLAVQWDVEPQSLDACVPPLILQPLVENALKHGVATRVERATLVIRAAMDNGRLRVSVRNDGPTLPTNWALESSKGFGLRNVHERLVTRGGACTLRVENAGTQGVLATIELPAVVTNG